MCLGALSFNVSPWDLVSRLDVMTVGGGSGLASLSLLCSRPSQVGRIIMGRVIFSYLWVLPDGQKTTSRISTRNLECHGAPFSCEAGDLGAYEKGYIRPSRRL